MTRLPPLDKGNLGHEREHDHGESHAGHRLLMLACCVPMLVIVGVLLATGAASGGAIGFALLCLAMMAAMMFIMPSGHDR